MKYTFIICLELCEIYNFIWQKKCTYCTLGKALKYVLPWKKKINFTKIIIFLIFVLKKKINKTIYIYPTIKNSKLL